MKLHIEVEVGTHLYEPEDIAGVLRNAADELEHRFAARRFEAMLGSYGQVYDPEGHRVGTYIFREGQ